MKLSNDDIKKNKFYVGSDTAITRKWGHANLDDAIAHAQTLMDSEFGGNGDKFIVKIVAVVKRQKQPVKVERVK